MAEKLGLRQGLILDVLDRLVSQAMGFNKRIRCNLPEVSVSTSVRDEDEVTPYVDDVCVRHEFEAYRLSNEITHSLF